MSGPQARPRRPWALDLEPVNLQKNQARFYLLSWQPTLFGWAVVRSYGRIGCWHRAMPPLPFDSLEQAWPLLRTIMRLRSRRPLSRCGGRGTAIR